jgi:pimeloyl-ACP methyl ester carboxylesterase
MIDIIRGAAIAAMVGTLMIRGFAGNLVRGLRAGVFLVRNMTERPSGDRNPRVRECRLRTGTGMEYDLYEPVRTAIRTVMAISGLTLKGEREDRLVNFCRALAESGVRVAAPALPAMKTFCFEESDLGIIIALIRELHEQEAAGISLIGFSVGGGLALAAAAAEEAKDAVDLAVVFGAHYDLGPVWQDLVRKHRGGPPTDDPDWENYIWLRMIMAYRRLSSLDLKEAEREEMTVLLGSYCDLPIATKKEYFERVMKSRRELTELAGFEIASVLAWISPRGRLLDLKAAVMVFHDPQDLLVPAGEARRLYEELKSRGPDARQRLLITPLLSHVNARATRRVMDVFPLLGMMGELFRRQAGGKDD